ncbi:urease accessory protein UreD [Hyphomicrobium sp. CS1GBMeth3]|uniref:urease accessory protein UreD n=1 Tax=Hyphomicrobium sp. CS1GBMeth3 TaxID=1892845 RepID=UPI0009301893|nr:urease accessory protein UreD [Hyphomicrobium sp. CS1GBMeth3]
MASLYLQSCAGGIYENDRLHLDISADADSRVHVTTQASTIVHTMAGDSARLETTLRVGANAWLEMISDPLILFSGSSLSSDVHLSIDPTGLAVLVDSFLLHDPQGTERPFSRFVSDTSIDVDGRGCVVRDRYSVTGAVVSERIPGITGRYRVQGTFLAVAPDGRLAPFERDLRQVLADARGIYAGVSQLPGSAGLWCRVLADDAVALRAALNGLWSILREKLAGRRPRPRRK